MVYLLDKATQVAQIVCALVAVGLILFLVYFVQSKKTRKRKITEEQFDYNSFDRRDTLEYVDAIEDIRDNMIITDHGTRFIAVIKCSGFDFFSEDIQTQLATCRGFYSFVNTITKPISYRQYSQPVDLEYTIDKYQVAYDEVVRQLYNAIQDQKDMADNLKKNEQQIGQQGVALYKKSIREGEKKIEALKFRKFHMEDQMRRLNQLTGAGVAPDIVETWVVEWVYNSFDFSVELSKEEIEKRAQEELRSMVRAKIHALSNCNVKAKRCTTEDLIDMCRRYSAPLSTDRFKAKDVANSSFFDDINTSESLLDLQREAEEEELIRAQEELKRQAKECAEQIRLQANKRFEEIYKNAAKAEAGLKKKGLENARQPVDKDKSGAIKENPSVKPEVKARPVRGSAGDSTSRNVREQESEYKRPDSPRVNWNEAAEHAGGLDEDSGLIIEEE